MRSRQKWWKKLPKDILLFVVFFFIAGIIVNILRQPEVPNNVLQNLNRPLIGTKENYRLPGSKPFIVHFWGIWCPVCKGEISNIASLSKDYEVITVAVNSGSDEDIEVFLDNRGLKLKVINDKNGDIASSFGIGVYPTTLIYDSNETLKFSEVGYKTVVEMMGRMLFVK